MNINILQRLIIVLLCLGFVTFSVNADTEKKLKSLQIAKLLAQRNIIETVYGVKVRFIEEVTDLKKGNFFGENRDQNRAKVNSRD